MKIVVCLHFENMKEIAWETQEQERRQCRRIRFFVLARNRTQNQQN